MLQTLYIACLTMRDLQNPVPCLGWGLRVSATLRHRALGNVLQLLGESCRTPWGNSLRRSWSASRTWWKRTSHPNYPTWFSGSSLLRQRLGGAQESDWIKKCTEPPSFIFVTHLYRYGMDQCIRLETTGRLLAQTAWGRDRWHRLMQEPTSCCCSWTKAAQTGRRGPATELSLEVAPPLGALGQHVPPDLSNGEQPFSRLLDHRWAEVMMKLTRTLKIGHPKRKFHLPTHWFSGVNLLFFFLREGTRRATKNSYKWSYIYIYNISGRKYMGNWAYSTTYRGCCITPVTAGAQGPPNVAVESFHHSQLLSPLVRILQ